MPKSVSTLLSNIGTGCLYFFGNFITVSALKIIKCTHSNMIVRHLDILRITLKEGPKENE
jgi:hypothetical protein